MSRSWVYSCAIVAAMGSSTSGSVQAQAPAKKETDADFLTKLEPFVVAAIKPDPADPPLRKLQKDRCRERAIALVRLRHRMDIGFWDSGDFNECLALPTTLAENLLELIDKPEDRLKCQEMRVEFLNYIFKFTDTRVQVGTDASQNRDLTKAALLAAEIDLFKFKEKAEKLKK